MISKITSNYQVTIPRAIRAALKLETADALEWTLQDGLATVRLAAKPFLRHRAAIKVGAGSISSDIRRAHNTHLTVRSSGRRKMRATAELKR